MEAIHETGNQYRQAVSRALEYQIGVPEDILTELKRMSSEEIGRSYSVGEIEDEFSGFVEEATVALEGLRLLGLESPFRRYELRLAHLRDGWKTVARKVFDAFPSDWTERRIELMKSAPPEFWWDRDFADKVGEPGG